MITLTKPPKNPSRRRFVGMIVNQTTPWLIGILTALSIQAQSFFDDFNSPVDKGWIPYDVLPLVGGTRGTFEVVNGVYHLVAPPTPNPAYGSARVGIYRPEIQSDFRVAADFVDWNTENRVQFGVFGRLNNPGLGRTGGYLFSYQTGTEPRDNRLAIYTIKGESGATLADTYDIVLDPTHDYRMVLTGVGATLIGELYDLENPEEPLTTLTAFGNLHSSGQSGVLAIAYKPGGFGEIWIDNFESSEATGSVNIPLLPKEAPVRFQAEKRYAASSTPRWIDSGDFNNDEVMDLVVPNAGGKSVSVFLNSGDGVIRSKTDYETGSGPFFVKVADLNKDNQLDLMVANTGATTISVLLGNGDGTFQTKIDQEVGPRPISLTAADLNLDGTVDVVVSTSGSNTVQVLLGNGDGTFQSKTEYAVGKTPGAVRSLDLNGDGILDVVVANNGESNVGVLIGKGEGAFHPMASFATPVPPGALEVGDFNSDGRTDVVTINHDAELVTLMLGKMDGTLETALTRDGFNHGHSLAVGDMNRDGKLDLVVGTDASCKVYVLIGKNDGTFEETLFPQGVSGHLYAMTIADLNQDGFPDLALANSIDNLVQVLLADPSVTDDFDDGNDDGWMRYDGLAAIGVAPATIEVIDGTYHFHAPAKPGVTSPGNPARAASFHPADVKLADFEVAVDIVDWDEESNTNIGLLARARNIGLGRSEGYFFVHQPNLQRVHISIVRGEAGYLLGQAPITLDPSRQYRMVFNGAGEYFTGRIFDLQNPDVPLVTLHARDSVFSDGLCGLVCFSALGDKDADARLDNYSAKTWSIPAPQLRIGPAPILNYSEAMNIAVGGQVWGNAVADINDDGHLDFAVVNNTGRKLSVSLGNGDGTFRAKQDTSVGTGPQYVAVADFNKDLIPDAAVSNGGSLVSVLIGNGDGTFQHNPVGHGVGNAPNLLKTADLNHDNAPDLAVLVDGDLFTSVLLNNGDGTFKESVKYAGGFRRIADVNGDSHPDLLVMFNTGVGILPGIGDGGFGDAIRMELPTNLPSMAVGDFNEDGRLDLAVTSVADNKVHLLMGLGDGTFDLQNSLYAPAAGFIETDDLDGDGHLDLVVRSSPSLVDSHGEAWQRLTLFLGSGDGRFDRGTTVRGGGSFGPMSLADLNGDGRTDLLVSNAVDFIVNLYLNHGLNPEADHQIELTWPTVTRGFALTSAGEINGEWTNLETPPTITHGPVQSMRLEKSVGTKFLRLIRER